MKKKLIIPLILIILIFSLSIVVSIFAIRGTATRKYIYIYQYEVDNFHFDKSKDAHLLYILEFDNSLTFEETIYSIDSNYYNTIQIKNGKCQVIDANCKNHICMHQTIDLNNFFTSYSISCMPSGLYIVYK